MTKKFYVEGLFNGTERARWPNMNQGGQTFKAAKAEANKVKQTALFE